ncbi:MAG TPA: hypothetical protein VIS71_07815 [Terrimicrobium sp.]
MSIRHGDGGGAPGNRETKTFLDYLIERALGSNLDPEQFMAAKVQMDC